MRILLIALFVGLFSQVTQAQWLTRDRIQNNQNFDKKLLQWGYYFGVNNFDFNFDYKEQQEDIQTERSIGFNVGLVGDLRLNDYFRLRLEPGLVYTQRNLTYPDTPQFENERDLVREIPSTYIYVPLLVRIQTKRLNNVKPFVTAGVSTAINLSSNEDNPDDNGAGEFRMITNPIFYELGFGIDLYFEWFKFTPSIRGVFAISDELVRDADPNSPWTSNIAKMQSRGIFVNFTFQ